MSYQLIDSGNEKKFEQIGGYQLVRPCAQAVWKPGRSEWKGADAHFSREPEGRWQFTQPLPSWWTAECGGVKFKISPTDFGHIGLFPEHAFLWDWMGGRLRPGTRFLNLFAYTGGATLAAAKKGASVCHLDASKTMVAWARENAALNNLEKAPIRWIVDDVLKFLRREEKRGVRYDAILLDPPTFGRGAKGEVFKIERDLREILELCQRLLSDSPLFLVLSCHTPGYSPLVLNHLLSETMRGGAVSCGEMTIPGPKPLPCGTYACWTAHKRSES